MHHQRASGQKYATFLEKLKILDDEDKVDESIFNMVVQMI